MTFSYIFIMSKKVIYVNELYHHGVKGMKWGVRHDREKSNKRSKSNDEESRKARRKKMIKIGATVAGVALLSYGGYRLYKSGKLDSLKEIRKISPKDDFGGKLEIPQKYHDVGFKILKEPQDIANDLKATSSERNKMIQLVGGKEKLPGAWSQNCGHASVAYIFRRMGFDVKPEPINFLNGGNENVFSGSSCRDIFDIFDTKNKIMSFSPRSHPVEELTNQIKKCGGNKPGTYGILKGTGNGGHFMAWENVNGTIRFLNPQDDKITDSVIRRAIDGGWWNTFDVINCKDAPLNTNYRNQNDPTLVYKRLKTIMRNN